ncbi:MAG: hypothetical protein CVU06_06785, partial [Bacteroidetes bacterium HGW-Bacteroidetes-22]
FDKQDATGNTLYAGALAGGIWKTVNQGLYWQKINLSGSNLAVSCMVQASDNKIYAGTGIYYDDQKENLRIKGTGLFVSTDGENFSLVAGTNGVGWEYINAVAFDNQGRMYVATATGLMYLDAGSSVWKVAKGTDDGVAVDLTGVTYDVKTSTDGLVIVFVNGKAYTSSNAGPEQFVCQSIKYQVGDVWENPTKLPKNGVLRMSFAIAPSAENVVYASSATTVGSLEGVYVSRDGGVNWSVILPFTTGTWNIFASSGTNYGAYNNNIIVLPNNPDKIFVGCMNMYSGQKVQDTGFYDWNGGPISFNSVDPSSDYYIHSYHNNYTFHPSIHNLMAIASDGGVTISKNGALTFVTVNKLLGIAHVRGLGVDNYDNMLVGTYSNGIQFLNAASGNPENGIATYDGTYTGHSGNVLMSQISTNMFFMNKSASVGTADYSTFMRTDDRGLSYSATFKDAAMTNGVELMPMVVHENYYDINSIDSTKFVAMKPFPAGSEVLGRSKTDRFPFPFVCPRDIDSLESIMIPDPVQSRYFIGWKDKLYMSMNLLTFSELPVWWKLAVADGNITSIAFSKDADYVYFGTNQGTLYRLLNVAAARTAEQASMDSVQCIITTEAIAILPNSSITSITTDKSDDNHLIFTIKSDDAVYANKYVYRTTNATEVSPAFTSIQGNLPDSQVNASLIEMNGNMAFVGTAAGLYYTENIAGADWVKESAMGTVPVNQIYQQTMQHSGLNAVEQYDKDGHPTLFTYYPPTTNYGVIYVATFGRGVWSSNNFVGIVDEPVNTVTTTKSMLNVMPNPVCDVMYLSLNNSFKGVAQVSVYDLRGQIVKTTSVEIGAHQAFSVNCSDLTRGTYMVRVSGGTIDVSRKFVIVK